MSDELHDYSEIYTPTGNEDKNLIQVPGSAVWQDCEPAPANVNCSNDAAGHGGTGTTTTNTSCR